MGNCLRKANADDYLVSFSNVQAKSGVKSDLETWEYSKDEDGLNEEDLDFIENYEESLTSSGSSMESEEYFDFYERDMDDHLECCSVPEELSDWDIIGSKCYDTGQCAVGDSSSVQTLEMDEIPMDPSTSKERTRRVERRVKLSVYEWIVSHDSLDSVEE